MDTSNPTLANDRRTIAQALAAGQKRRRQDLAFLKEESRNESRTNLALEPNVLASIAPITEVEDIIRRYKERMKPPTVIREPIRPRSCKIVSESMPVCGVLNEYGNPIHPPNRNNSQGRVTVTRQFGGGGQIPRGFARLVEVLSEEVLDVDMRYTYGTPQGLNARIDKQMGRRTHDIIELFNIPGQVPQTKLFYDYLDHHMPRKQTNWLGIQEDFMDTLMNRVKITMSASAGAPYWRSKGDVECMNEIIGVGIPLVMQALKTDTIDKLYKENPELFLVELKNKLDRYKLSEWTTKTRPYLSIPAHWALLFSLLSQGFQEGMILFDNPEGTPSSNAYGFSAAHGGLMRMYRKLMTADSRGLVFCYSDDGRIAVRRDGQVWLVDPDFSQFDGSISKKDVHMTIVWILRHLKKDLGLDNIKLWESIGAMWEKFATDPVFIIDSTQIFMKNEPNGLISGVPGTTLFGTVKSVTFWNMYLDHCNDSGLNPLDEAIATNFAENHGLIIKPGTWRPTPIPELQHNTLMTDHKFLGMQMLAYERDNGFTIVPTIPHEEMVNMLCVQKDTPFEKQNATQQERRLYDRMRGFFITCGAIDPIIRSAIHHVVNSISPEIILMFTQNERGEAPESIALEGFEFPDSSGFPSFEFFLDLYTEGVEEPAQWTQIFPQTFKKLEDIRKPRILKTTNTQAFSDPPSKDLAFGYEELPPLDSILEVPESLVKARAPTFNGDFNTRSRILRTSGQIDYAVAAKYIPDVAQALVNLLNHKMVMHVKDVERIFDLYPQRLEKIAMENRLYLTGYGPSDLISIEPIKTPFPTVQDDIVQATQDLALEGIAIKHGKDRRHKPPNVLLNTAPSRVFLKPGAFAVTTFRNREVNNLKESMDILTLHFEAPVEFLTRLTENDENVVEMYVNTELVGTATGAIPSMLKGYLVKAACQALQVSVAQTSSTTVDYIVVPVLDWGTGEMIIRNSRAPPEIVSLMDSNEKKENRVSEYVEVLRREYPRVDEYVMRALLDVTLVNEDTQDQESVLGVLRSALNRHLARLQSHNVPTAPRTIPGSARSKLTEERRRALNRKSTLKRKHLKQSLRAPPPEQNPPFLNDNDNEVQQM